MFGPSAGETGCMITAVVFGTLAAMLFLFFYLVPADYVLEILRLGAVVVVFGLAISLVMGLWKLVLDALGNDQSSNAKALIRLVGGADLHGELPEGIVVRLRGVGLSGTFVVLLIAVALSYFILNAPGLNR